MVSGIRILYQVNYLFPKLFSSIYVSAGLVTNIDVAGGEAPVWIYRLLVQFVSFATHLLVGNGVHCFQQNEAAAAAAAAACEGGMMVRSHACLYQSVSVLCDRCCDGAPQQQSCVMLVIGTLCSRNLSKRAAAEAERKHAIHSVLQEMKINGRYIHQNNRICRERGKKRYKRE